MAKPQSLFQGVLLDSMWFGLCRVLGLGKQIWFAALFGLSATLDTYLFALGTVALVTTLSSGWLINVSTVYLAQVRGTLGLDACLRRAAGLTWLALGSGLAIAAVFGLLAPMLSNLAVGFDEAQRAAVAHGLLLLIPVVCLAAVDGIMTATLRATRQFSVAGQSEFASSLAALLVMWLWTDHPHILFFVMATSSVTKVLWQSAKVVPMIVAHRPSMVGAPAFFRRYLLLLASPIIGVAGGAAHNAVLSYLPTGGLAALSFAFIFSTMAAGMLNVNIGLNTVINEERARDLDALNKLWNESISLAIVCIVPVIVFAGFYGEDLVSLLLQYGAFDETAAKIVGALLVLTFTLALHDKVQGALATVLHARFIIIPLLVSRGIAVATGLLAKILLVLGLGWGVQGIVVSEIIAMTVLIASQAIAASRHDIHMAVGAHARWAAWSAGCGALAILPLWLLTQTWTLPKLGILPVGAAYLAGFAVLVWQYRGAEKALLAQYTQRLVTGARKAFKH